jgi:hypothetical protein
MSEHDERVIAELEKDVFGPPPLPLEIMPVTSRYLSPGTDMETAQHIYRLNNDYGASVVRGFGTYGYREPGLLWELAVIRFGGPGTSNEDWHIARTRLIRGDTVKGWLTVEDVGAMLLKIAALPPAYKSAP